ncbi:hypothetical protein TorRG33x02_009960 [Trema orientale]|uniref:Uncharacterized protein n=1 Tax=Trema orientale TaxID=63057 RepID=A0A2P5FYS1_TREOI|nr:hypothetical protein TorRG33x02_009960 [Trema orientale]
MEEIFGKWNSLSITKDEETEVALDAELVKKCGEGLNHVLIGKLLARKPYNKKAFKDVISNIWRVDRRPEIKEVAKDTFCSPLLMNLIRKGSYNESPSISINPCWS